MILSILIPMILMMILCIWFFKLLLQLKNKYRELEDCIEEWTALRIYYEASLS